MNIAFAKIGKSIKFRRNSYSPVGGDNEPSCILRSLATHNPDKTFYVIGRSDFHKMCESERLDLFPYDNVIDIWTEFPDKLSMDYLSGPSAYKYFNYPMTYFKDRGIQLDYGLIMVGQLGAAMMPGKTRKIKEPNNYASIINMTKNYATPVANWINETDIPYMEIINDPRYTLAAPRDIIRKPTVSISQYDYTYTKKHIRSFDDQTIVTTDVDVVYAGVEKSFCTNYIGPSLNTDRDIPFMIVLNEGKPSRYKLLKEWVLDTNDPDVEIYGQWDEEIASKDRRFRGSLHLDSIQKKLEQVRSTFIIPIAPGWVTAKYIEMIHAGVVPFLHPTYDDQGHTKIPHEFRPKNPRELHRLIRRISRDDEYYFESIQKLRDLIIDDDLYNGKYINQQIMSHVIDDYKPIEKSSYNTKTAHSLDSFFE